MEPNKSFRDNYPLRYLSDPRLVQNLSRGQSDVLIDLVIGYFEKQYELPALPKELIHYIFTLVEDLEYKEIKDILDTKTGWNKNEALIVASKQLIKNEQINKAMMVIKSIDDVGHRTMSAFNVIEALNKKQHYDEAIEFYNSLDLTGLSRFLWNGIPRAFYAKGLNAMDADKAIEIASKISDPYIRKETIEIINTRGVIADVSY